MLKKALFLDRDGVINEDCQYPSKKEDIVFKQDIFEFCRFAESKGYLIIVVTNQSGIGRGYFTEDDLMVLHSWMKEVFANQGITITDFYFSPYHIKAIVEKYKKESDCRKPKPGMILRAVEEYSIDLKKSVMIGDKLSDRIELPELSSYILKSQYVTDGYDGECLEDFKKFL